MEELSAIPVWLCIPFAGLLLSIAVMPLIKPDWWEKHQPLAVAFWSVLFIVPFAAKYGMFTMGETVLECVVNDYLTFIILLFGLFCVAGNITIDGEFAGSPRINTALFVLGTLLSSVIGTTGSSMLLVRPFIKMNSWRKRKSHIMIFFIFLISNMGGCLTPIGDPPLLMGFMRGVPFFWSLKLFHILIFNMIILLMLFYFLDRRAYRKDIAEGRKPDIREPGTHVRIVGLHNLIYVAMIVGAVILSGMLSLLITVGGPMAWMRLSLIGSVMFESIAAGFGTASVGVQLGADTLTPLALDMAVWTMILGSIGWIIFATISASRMDKVQHKISGGDPAKLMAISSAAIIGAFSSMSSSHLIKLNKNSVACVLGAVFMAILLTISEKKNIKWLKEWNLTISILAAMIITAVI